MKIISVAFSYMVYCVYFFSLGVFCFVAAVWFDAVSSLPPLDELEKYQPAQTTRIYADDGSLIGDYAVERRVYVPLEQIPVMVQKAFIATEDKRFYEHSGYDLVSIARAALDNVGHIINGRRPVGASTITQQVARNFLLSDERTLRRKLREVMTAGRIESALSKEHILELYLNKIYLGIGTYGVASAALLYFDKALHELNWNEAAYLASLPKAPSNYHPVRNYEAALARRNWALGRLRADGVISELTYVRETARPLEAKIARDQKKYRADYFIEEVRRKLLDLFDSRAIYHGGLSVRTSLDPVLQAAADTAIFDGLQLYDKRHGWRGPLSGSVFSIDLQSDLARYFEENEDARNEYDKSWRVVIVDNALPERAEIIFEDGSKGQITLKSMQWARWQSIDENGDEQMAPAPISTAEVLKRGDIILVMPGKDTKRNTQPNDGLQAEEGATLNPWLLTQRPQIDGGIIALDVHTGRVRAMTGGWSFSRSQFNRATQARRQPGSAFKPFVYLAALENGYTPATRILDAPIVIDNGPGEARWRPENYSRVFYGPAAMRIGIEASRNLMTVRLAMAVGLLPVIEAGRRLGINSDLPFNFATALGAGETTLERLTSAYAMIVNGGKEIKSSLIDQVNNSAGSLIFRNDQRGCGQCSEEWREDLAPPILADLRQQVIDPKVAYQLTSMLEGVVERGTGRRLRYLRRPMGGKTGTTNKSIDTWFMGFTPDLAIGVYAGFDMPRTLNNEGERIRETGASVALPIWGSFVNRGLRGTQAVPFRAPSGVSFVRIDPKTGKLATRSTENAIVEVFKEGDKLPSSEESQLITGDSSSSVSQPQFIPQAPSDNQPSGNGIY